MLMPFKFIYSSILIAGGSATTYVFLRPLKSLISHSIFSELSLTTQTDFDKLTANNVDQYAINVSEHSKNFTSFCDACYNFIDIKTSFWLFIMLGTALTFVFFHCSFKALTRIVKSMFNPYDYYYSFGYYAKPEQQSLQDSLMLLSEQVECLLRAVEHNERSICLLRSDLEDQIALEQALVKETVYKQTLICVESTKKMLKDYSEHYSELLDICNQNITKNSKRLENVYKINKAINCKLIYISKRMEALDSPEVQFDELSESITNDQISVHSIALSGNVSLNATVRLKDLNEKIDQYDENFYKFCLNKIEGARIHCDNKDSTVFNFFDSNAYFSQKYSNFIPTHFFTVGCNSTHNNTMSTGFFNINNAKGVSSKSGWDSEVFVNFQQLSIVEKGCVIVGSSLHQKLDKTFYQSLVNNCYSKKFIMSFLISD